ncbi:hypothetical protein EYR40_009942 [Pleurotus pulmonarius]|nr:hypothetical protein EYR38_002977 [Pleurotus pulmonarius]KAF4591339.1 hypothetical protein EYR40_009942 [Pleurotus pulmonarius]
MGIAQSFMSSQRDYSVSRSATFIRITCKLQEVADPYHEGILLSLAPRYNAPALSASVYTPPSSRRYEARADWGETEECGPATGAGSSVEPLEEILAYVTDGPPLHNRLIVSRAFEYPLAVEQFEVFRRAIHANPPVHRGPYQFQALRRAPCRNPFRSVKHILAKTTGSQNAEHGCRGVAEAGLLSAARSRVTVYPDEADNGDSTERVPRVCFHMTEWPPPLKGISFPKLRSMIKPAVLGSQADGCKAAYSTVVSDFGATP